MPIRTKNIITGEIHHILSKSIAKFQIFRDDAEYMRMQETLRYYRNQFVPVKFSSYLELKNKNKFFDSRINVEQRLVDIIAYSIMPTHIHLVLKQIKDNGIVDFTRKILNSYARYFNTRTKRRGPLWESRFKNVLVETDEQLLHLTRYVHLNPVTAYLVDKPIGWMFSSYGEYVRQDEVEKPLCNYSKVLSIDPKEYRRFVRSRIDYQRELADAKRTFIE
jgi:putative transposase